MPAETKTTDTPPRHKATHILKIVPETCEFSSSIVEAKHFAQSLH